MISDDADAAQRVDRGFPPVALRESASRPAPAAASPFASPAGEGGGGCTADKGRSAATDLGQRSRRCRRRGFAECLTRTSTGDLPGPARLQEGSGGRQGGYGAWSTQESREQGRREGKKRNDEERQRGDEKEERSGEG